MFVKFPLELYKFATAFTTQHRKLVQVQVLLAFIYFFKAQLVALVASINVWSQDEWKSKKGSVLVEKGHLEIVATGFLDEVVIFLFLMAHKSIY